MIVLCNEERLGNYTITTYKCLLPDEIENLNEIEIFKRANFVKVEVDSHNVNVVKYLNKNNFFFADRTVRVRVPCNKNVEMVRAGRFDISVNEFQHNIIFNISKQCFTKDRRFHLKRNYDNTLAAELLDAYIQNAQKMEMIAVYCNYKEETVGFALLKQLESDIEVCLAAVLPKFHGAGAAIEMYDACKEYCFKNKKRNLIGRISSANTAVMNIYSMLGGIFYESIDVYIYEGNK